MAKTASKSQMAITIPTAILNEATFLPVHQGVCREQWPTYRTWSSRPEPKTIENMKKATADTPKVLMILLHT